MTFYPLDVQEADKAIEFLCPTGLRLFLYIKSRCPFEDSKPNFSVDDLVAQFKVHRHTILRLLREMKRIELLSQQLHARILNVFSTKSERSPRSFKESLKDRGDLSESLNPAPSEASGVTNNRFKNSDQTIGKTPGNEQGWLGQILTAIEEAGVRANRTIQTTIQKLQQEFGVAAAARRVELAIGSLQEQQSKGILRNPGGFFNAALQRHFTPNDDGYRSGRSADPSPAPPPASPPAPPPDATSPPAPPPASPPAPPPGATSPPAPPASPPPGASQTPPRLSKRSMLKFEQQCDLLLQQGDRAAVMERLRSALAQGYEEDVIDLLMMRRDWKIRFKGKELIDKSVESTPS